MNEQQQDGGLRGAYRLFREEGSGRVQAATIAPIYYAVARLIAYKLSVNPMVKNSD